MGQAFARALDAVAHPARLRIVRHLAARGAASVDELSEAAGVHPNTTRAHLAALETAAVVARETEAPRGPGRPPLRFRLHEDAGAPGPGDLRELAEVLAAAIGRPRGRGLARLRGLAAGWARRSDGGDGAGAADAPHSVAEGFARLGFHARLHADRVELAGCPCPLVAPDHPATICAVAHGAADGLLAATGLCVRAARHDPNRRSCVLWLRASPAPSSLA